MYSEKKAEYVYVQCIQQIEQVAMRGGASVNWLSECPSMFMPITEHNHNTCRLINDWIFSHFQVRSRGPHRVRLKLIKFLYY